MKDNHNLVTFKSVHTYYAKEKKGSKCCTVRKIDATDDRFQRLRKGCQYICIALADNPDENFVRKITDYSEWEGLGIISWRVE